MGIRKLKLWYKYIIIGFKSISNYKLSNILNIISTFLFILLQYYLWRSIYLSNQELSLSITQGIEYIIFAQLIYAIYPNDLSQKIAKLVRNGDILLYLLKPFSFFMQLFLEELGKSLFKCLRVIFIIFVLYLLFPFEYFSISKIIVFIIILCLSYLISFFIEVIFGLFSFFTNSFWGINSVKYAIITFFSAKLIPITFYPLIVRNIIDFLPFKYMYIYPLSYLLNLEVVDLFSVVLLLFNVIILMGVAHFIFKLGIKKLEIQGG